MASACQMKWGSTTPFYHPILPLLHDRDLATIDRPGAVLPRRFSAPEDAQAQVEDAAHFYAERFGMRPRGMWPIVFVTTVQRAVKIRTGEEGAHAFTRS